MTMLFPLALKGYGTRDIESISSYVHQLAHMHGVSVGRLLERSYGWYLENNNDVAYHQFRNCGGLSALIRPKESTRDLVIVLEFATGERNLRSGSFLALYSALDRARDQFAKHMRWCPSCMHEYEVSGDPGYYKLIWGLMDVIHCPDHHVLLVDKCPVCESYQDGFGSKKICRICQNCGSSLGKEASKEDIVPTWELKGMDLINLVEIIAKNPTLNYPENGIRDLLDSIHDKAWNNDEEDMLWSKIPRGEYLALVYGNTTVSLQIARRFSSRLGVELHDLLMGRIDSLPGLLESEWFKDIPNEFKPKKRHVKHSKEEIFPKLLEYLSDKYRDYPLPFSQIAKAIGVSKGYLEYHFPEICKTVTNRYRSWHEHDKLKKRHIARAEALNYFNSENITFSRPSKKAALKAIRDKTALPKNMLMDEIGAVYDLLFSVGD